MSLAHLKVNVAAGKETKEGVLSEVKDTDWREDLKHVEPAKDASAPAIDPHLKLNLKAGKERKEVRRQYQNTLQNTSNTLSRGNKYMPVCNFCVLVRRLPRIMYLFTALLQNLKKEIGQGAKLRPAAVVHDASAPEVPEPIKCPDTAKVQALLKKHFANTSTRGWVLLGYKDKVRVRVLCMRVVVRACAYVCVACVRVNVCACV